MELNGTVKKLTEAQTFASGFQKREMVIVTDEQYPQPISIEFLQDNVHLLNTVKEGDKVKVGINLRGREWVSPQGETKYFNSIVGWRIEKSSGDKAKNDAPTQSTNPLLQDDDEDSIF